MQTKKTRTAHTVFMGLSDGPKRCLRWQIYSFLNSPIPSSRIDTSGVALSTTEEQDPEAMIAPGTLFKLPVFM